MTSLFPTKVRELPAFDGPFDAHRLDAAGCTVLFATYPGGTEIDVHDHDTDNMGVITAGEWILVTNGVETRHRAGDWYQVPARTAHAARFEQDTAEIETWFSAESDPD